MAAGTASLIAAIVGALATVGSAAASSSAQGKAARGAAIKSKTGYDAEGQYTPVAKGLQIQPGQGVSAPYNNAVPPAPPGIMMMGPGGGTMGAAPGGGPTPMSQPTTVMPGAYKMPPMPAKEPVLPSPQTAAMGSPPVGEGMRMEQAMPKAPAQDNTAFSQTLKDSQMAVQIGTQLMNLGQSMRPQMPQAPGMLPAAGSGMMQPTAGQFQSQPRLGMAMQGGQDPRMLEMMRRQRLGSMYG